mgnify:CR=1 FL=1
MANVFQGFETIAVFSRIFPFLLVLFITYAVLENTKLFGDDKKATNAVVAFIFAMVVAISPAITYIINTMAPWFVMLTLLVVFMLMVSQIFGFNSEDVKGAVSERSYIITTLVVVGLVVFAGALAGAFGQDLLSGDGAAPEPEKGVGTGVNATGDVAGDSFQENLWGTIFHPKVLGMIVIFLMSTFALRFLTDEGKTLKQ